MTRLERRALAQRVVSCSGALLCFLWVSVPVVSWADEEEALLRIEQVRDNPDPFSPNGDGRLEATTLSAQIAVRPDDPEGLDPTEEDFPEELAEDRQDLLEELDELVEDGGRARLTWTLQHPSTHQPLRSLVQEQRIQPPFAVEALPTVGANVGHFLVLPFSQVWDGQDSQGRLLADGIYPYAVQAIVEESDDEEDDDAVRASLEGAGTLTLDTTPPVLTIEQPLAGQFTNDPTPTVQLAYSDTLAGIDPANLQVQLDTLDFVAGCVVTTTTASCETSPLTDGPHTVVATIRDQAANETSASATFFVDTTPPATTAAVSPPPNAAGWNNTDVLVSLAADDGAGSGVREIHTTLDANLELITPGASVEIPVTDEGTHTLRFFAIDRVGNVEVTKTAVVDIDRTPPSISASVIPAPNAAGWNSTDVTVVFTATDSLSGVAEVTPPVNMTTEGPNQVVTGNATDLAGNTASTSVTVNVDKTPPVVSIASPQDGVATNQPSVTVNGMVTDANPIASVTVNGTPITLTNGAFSHELTVTEGPTTIEVVATDIAGNTGRATRIVTLDTTPPDPPIVFPVTSPTRLIFQMFSGDAEPTSHLDITGGLDPVSLEVFENGMFMVNVNLRLDTVNQLALTSTDAAGNRSAPREVTIVQSRELPQPGPGEPARINVASGDTQTGIAGQPLVHPIAAIVTDPNGDPVAGVAVTFQTPMGGLVNGGTAAVVQTGADGRAQAIWTLGQEPGTQMVMANFAGNQNPAVEFMAEALAPRPIEETRISGVILDNDLRAIPGVRVNLVGTTFSSVTDEEGRFVILNPPIGNGQLLDIDASGATLPGTFSDLAFEINVLPGQDNQLPRPLFLPLLNEGIEIPHVVIDVQTVEVLEERAFVMPTEPNVAPVTLRIPVGTRITFPPGVERKISVTRVPLNRVPMALEDGLFSQVYVSVQPEGALFDPPLPICFPNLDGAAPGEQVILMSFVHEFGRFTEIGPATVSADGRQVCSDPGVGIRQADWHATPRRPTALVTTICGQQALPQGLTDADLECDCWCTSQPAARMGGGVFCAGNVPVSSANISDFRFDEGQAAAQQELRQRGGTANLECVCRVRMTLTVEPKPLLLHQTGTATLTATATPAGGTFTWTSSNTAIATVTGSGNPATVTGVAPGSTQVRVTYTIGQQSKTESVDVTVFTVQIDHPSGDPVAAPAATNEFTYTAASPGVLTMLMRARLDPDTAAVRALLESNRLRWRVDSIDDSHAAQQFVQLRWSSVFPEAGRGPFTTGEGLTTTATFTGLPPDNSDFGTKTVQLECLDDRGNVVVTRSTTVEVFYPRDQTNHPDLPGRVDLGNFSATNVDTAGRGNSTRSPNWFFYWNQAAAGDPDARFDSTAPGATGVTPALFNWQTYTGPRDRILVRYAGNAELRDTINATGALVTGIDRFANTILHENRHVLQVTEHNGLNPHTVATAAGAKVGWSWANAGAVIRRSRVNIQAALYNHFQVGPDGQPGVAGVDDDGDWRRGGPDGQPGVAGVDEDGDGVADDVTGQPAATPEANTTNNVDDDRDGVVDDTAAHAAGRPEPFGAGDDHDLNNDGVPNAGEPNVDELDEFIAGPGDTVVGDDVDLDPDGDLWGAVPTEPDPNQATDGDGVTAAWNGFGWIDNGNSGATGSQPNRAETNAEGTFVNVDFGDPGKQRRTAAFDD
jgi:hypothetical protein